MMENMGCVFFSYLEQTPHMWLLYGQVYVDNISVLLASLDVKVLS